MIAYIIIAVLTIIAASAYVTRDGDYDIDNISMSVVAGFFWPLTIPICIGIVLGGFLKGKRWR